MAYRASLGIAVEETGVSAVHLASSFGKLRVVAQASYPLPRDLPADEKLQIARENLGRFLVENRVHTKNVFLGIPRDLSFVRYVEFPAAVKENLRETLQYEIEKFIPFPAEDVSFDFMIVRENGEDDRIGVVLLMARKSALQPFLNLMAGLGKGIAGIEISSTALVNFCQTSLPHSRREDSVLVYRSGGRLEVNFVSNGILSYSKSTIPRTGDGGGQTSLVGELEILEQALGLEGESLPLLFGGRDEEFEAVLGLCREKGWEARPIAWGKAGLRDPALLPAYGLALRGLRQTPMEIDLLPPELRKKASRVGMYCMFGLLGLMLLAGLGWGGGVIAQQRAAAKKLETEIKRLGTEIALIERKREGVKELETHIDYLVSLRRDRPVVLDILKELTQIIPENAWVRSLSFSGKDVQIEGYGESASDLIPLLEAAPLFKDVAFLAQITKTKDGKDQFRIGLQLESHLK